MTSPDLTHRAFGNAAHIVALANPCYFAVELAAGQQVGSASFFADSIDFLKDASVNLLILLALDWPARKKHHGA